MVQYKGRSFFFFFFFFFSFAAAFITIAHGVRCCCFRSEAEVGSSCSCIDPTGDRVDPAKQTEVDGNFLTAIKKDRLIYSVPN